jgi:DNA ligase-1
LRFRNAKPALLRGLIAERTDPVLFGLSYDYVGDLSETIALLWPARPGSEAPPSLSAVVETLSSGAKLDLGGKIAGWLDALDETGRWALLKLVTGALRIGVSARLAKTALAAIGGFEPDAIEEVWHGLKPPYIALFAWVEGQGPRPDGIDPTPFRSPMLAHALEDRDMAHLSPEDFVAEWKWDGIRVQAAAGVDGVGRVARLYSRAGEDISAGFPDMIDMLTRHDVGGFALDGELLVRVEKKIGSFNALQQRLNRKIVSAPLILSHPGHIRAYDLLAEGDEDLRALPFCERRRRLEAFVEGLMLKRRDSPYLPGRPKGLWYKWKRDPRVVDAVLMYAQRGHGKRSSFYSDFTFGVWRGEGAEQTLVPVGKAYFGFTDAELAKLDRYVRNHTKNRFGPVREVGHGLDEGLVLEIAFEGLNRSPRHKSGVAMRFPRVARIRWDKPAREADRLDTLERLLMDAE